MRRFLFANQPNTGDLNMLELPQELVIALTGFLTLFVTNLVVEGFKSLSDVFHWDLSKVATIFAAAISTAVVGIAIGLINLLLGFVPPAWYPVVQAFLLFLVGTLGAMGVHRRAKLARAG
jgi:hypothetical protein